MSDTSTIIASAVIGSLGPTIAVFVNIILNKIASNKAEESARAVEHRLIAAAKKGDDRLEALKKSSDDNLSITEQTHSLVNGQRDAMVRLVASLSRRIADENPEDSHAQDSADDAEHNAQLSDC